MAFWNWNKEGPGVDPDEPEKGPIGEFFSIYFSKFWRICGIGMLTFIASLLTIALLYYIGFYLLHMVLPVLSYERILAVLQKVNLPYAQGITVETMSSYFYFATHLIFVMTLFSLGFFALGPIHVGFTYIYRNFAIHDPVFLWSDIKDSLVANWKKSLIHSIISALALCLGIYAYYFYNANLPENIMLYVLRAFLLMYIFTIIVMQFYVYQMIVTFDLKLRHIYKNALILTLIKVPSNFFILLILLIINFVIPFLAIWGIPSQAVAVIIFALQFSIGVGLSNFLINFFASRGIKKYLIDPYDNNKNGGAQSSVTQKNKEHYESDWHYQEDIPQETAKDAPAGAPA